MPAWPASGSVLANTVYRFATPALVMKRLPPSSTYSSPSCRAVVRIAAESEPEPASVKRVGTQPLARRQPRQVALLLLARAGQLQTERAELLHGEDQAAGRAHLRDLLDRDQRHQRARAGSAPLLVEEQAEQLVLAEELDDVPRELVALVDLGRPRRDPLTRQGADELPELALFLGQHVPGHGLSLDASRVALRDPRERHRPDDGHVVADDGRARDRGRPHRRRNRNPRDCAREPGGRRPRRPLRHPRDHRVPRPLPHLGDGAAAGPARRRDLGGGRSRADTPGRRRREARPLVPRPGLPRDELAGAADEGRARRRRPARSPRRSSRRTTTRSGSTPLRSTGPEAICASTRSTGAWSSSAPTTSRPG